MSKMNWAKAQQQTKADKAHRSGDCYNKTKNKKPGKGARRNHTRRHNEALAKGRARQKLNTEIMQLASKLYIRLSNEPDFAGESDAKLWDLALQTTRQVMGWKE